MAKPLDSFHNETDVNSVWMKPEDTPKADREREALETGKDAGLQAWQQWQASKTPDNAGKMLKHLDPVINTALRTYVPGSEDSLRTQARLMAVKTLDNYDPAKAKLNTYIIDQLKGIRRVKADRENVIHIPENVSLEKNALFKASEAFKSQEGREPSALELADATGISVKRQAKISQYKPAATESSFLSDKGDLLYSKKTDPARVLNDYVYHDLDPVDRKIFEWATGHGGSERIPRGEMARRLNISAPAVSQRINRIVSRMQGISNL